MGIYIPHTPMSQDCGSIVVIFLRLALVCFIAEILAHLELLLYRARRLVQFLLENDSSILMPYRIETI